MTTEASENAQEHPRFYVVESRLHEQAAWLPIANSPCFVLEHGAERHMVECLRSAQHKEQFRVAYYRREHP